MTGEAEGPEWEAMAGYNSRARSMEAVSRDTGPGYTVCMFFLDLQQRAICNELLGTVREYLLAPEDGYDVTIYPQTP